MTMIQGPFLDRSGADNHDRGWTSAFVKLDALLAHHT
jgi:hypothetical protein